LSYSIKELIRAVKIGCYRITEHAREKMERENLLAKEVFISLFRGEIIEIYLDDRPYPSCLVLGWTANHEPIHSVWAYAREMAYLITVYRPDPARWINWRERRREQ
jgi:hypothetical protein